MKIGFFEIEDWESEKMKAELVGYDCHFFAERIDADDLPVDKDYDAISIFTGSKI